ncbi:MULTISPECIES: flagellar basal body-associated protein FliL [unclassified Janthinobacterium]|uniref:flagellar basal body-associated protein FliL n=1 Tax=unclassified Janthinobacterium TaxID=2610881 RepID=UPI0016098292|nr:MULTISPECIES: flagellar basal body-associated protein FliL [unclassified Janthinobacterium]MBB5608704.1 flagellar FliL protein [Janthinobacterium sp. S3T4]MBB5613893.1 flagellar FliL protein [Janthinobacterium sp. S3M3]
MKADPKADASLAPAGASKKKLLIIVLASVLLAGGIGGGAAWYFLHGKADKEDGAPAKKKVSKAGPPVFVPIDSFTVNLQPENGEQYLQIAFTLQVPNPEEMDNIKLNMPKVRSRLLLLLSGKKASELNTVEGKQQLAAEIIAQVNQPFVDKGPEQEVSDVLFTAFIIQ